jgi:DNA-directed RNA polymerase specialized sigma24 family protein
LDDKYAEADRSRAELSRLGQRRREALETLRRLDAEADTLMHRARDTGLDVQEIADRLGFSRQTVHKYLRRGR